MIVVALVLLMGVRKDWASGLGLALLLVSTTLFFVDVFGERRAQVYTNALLSVAAQWRAPPPP